MAAILNSAILDSAILHKKISLMHSHWTWWWQPSWILPFWIQTLPSWIQTPWYLLSDSLKNTLTPLWLWLKLIQSDSNSFILTQLDDGRHLKFSLLHKKTSLIDSDWTDDGSHLEFCYLDFGHLSFFSQTHSHVAKLVPTICSKKIYSFILNKLDDGSHLKFCHLEFCYLGFSHLSFLSQTHSHLPRLAPTICTKKLHSFILTQFDDGSHLEFCHLGFSHFAQNFDSN